MSAPSGASTRLAYYNENDPRAAAWLRELISAGHIARGIVDERSVEDVYPSDLEGFAQCHFFAGIGGWSLALRMAGVPDDYAVWTGSCPCQPFSAAGRRSGFADERHLWPAWFYLIAQRRPKLIFGEQVASALGWLDLISTDLENEAYALWTASIGAHSVRAPHIRQRLYYVAYADGGGPQARHGDLPPARHGHAAATGGSVDQLADTNGWLSGTQREQRSWQHGFKPQDRSVDQLADGSVERLEKRYSGPAPRELTTVERGCAYCDGCGYFYSCVCQLGDTSGTGSGRNSRGVPSAENRERELQSEPNFTQPPIVWTDCDWIYCRDGKYRPVEPGSFPLVNGLPDRVGLLRGYGNAIIPQLAAAFIEAALG